jgi:hypothetical protein
MIQVLVPRKVKAEGLLQSTRRTPGAVRSTAPGASASCRRKGISIRL